MKRLAKQERAEHQFALSDKVASKIASAFHCLQASFANYMNKRAANMNKKRLKKSLAAFTVAGGGFSLFLIVSSLTKPIPQKLHVDQVNVPKHMNKAGDEETLSSRYVDEETFYNIEVFKRYMDSLKTVAKPQYDSIMQARPRLMDSVTMLEQLYHLQKQNSDYEK